MVTMLDAYLNHNRFLDGLSTFEKSDPHLHALSELTYQYYANWWGALSFNTPGIYILTGGRQVGKSTSCKQLIKYCLQKKSFKPKNIFYLPCDEIYDAKELSHVLRYFLEDVCDDFFLLVIDEITFVKDWDRTIKALADEGHFRQGLCLLTGSDTLILKEAAMRFPGRRGKASQTDFHLYPLSFSEYTKLRATKKTLKNKELQILFNDYLLCGGYLRAINDLALLGEVTPATFLAYEQWIRGDFLKQGKNEDYLLAILSALFTVGVSQISYSSLTRKVGLVSKETCINYCRLLERLDILINLQAFDQNKKQGFPRKDRKFHFTDPFIYHTISRWLKREGYLNNLNFEGTVVEASVASHCHRLGRTYYFKGQGEVDVIWLHGNDIRAIEVKWSNQLRPADVKSLQQFDNTVILGKLPEEGVMQNILTIPVYRFLYKLGS